jgi:ankyrin repeat protein
MRQSPLRCDFLTQTPLHMDAEFIDYCKTGNLEMIKYMHSQYQYNVHIDDDIGFILCCYHGHLDIANWLYNMNANIHTRNDLAFRLCCTSGNITMAKWLYSLGVNMHANNEYAFRFACANGQLDVAKWLYSLNANIYEMDSYAFRIACANDCVDIARWLCLLNSQYKIKIMDAYIADWSIDPIIYSQDFDLFSKYETVPIDTIYI